MAFPFGWDQCLSMSMENGSILKRYHQRFEGTTPTSGPHLIVFLHAFFWDIWWSDLIKWHFDLSPALLIRIFRTEDGRRRNWFEIAGSFRMSSVAGSCNFFWDRCLVSTGGASGFQNPVKNGNWGNYWTGKACKRIQWHPCLVLWRSFLVPVYLIAASIRLWWSIYFHPSRSTDAWVELGGAVRFVKDRCDRFLCLCIEFWDSHGMAWYGNIK